MQLFIIDYSSILVGQKEFRSQMRPYFIHKATNKLKKTF